MKVHTFIADSAANAVAQIRAELGPEAIVLNVRQVPREGLARLWQKPSIEVMACLPEAPAPAPATDPLAELRAELAEIRRQLPTRRESPSSQFRARRESTPVTSISWRIDSVLQRTGLLPVHAAFIATQLKHQHGDNAPQELEKECQLARNLLKKLWIDRETRRPPKAQTHVFVGAPGSGKTTVLCKWLAQSVLLESQPATVWRLDGHVANAAESLSIYCDILGVRLERFPVAQPDETLLFIDLPGINWRTPAELAELQNRLKSYPDCQIHLVLNLAYEPALLLDQIQAFSSLPIADLIFTHLDEEPRWGKLWNFLLGTDHSIGFLSAGQNIPGDFQAASPEKIFSVQFPK